MSKFMVGDKVKVVGTKAPASRQLLGQTGIVVRISQDYCNLDLEGDSQAGLWDTDLELVKRGNLKITVIVNKRDMGGGIIYYDIVTVGGIKEFRFYKNNDGWGVSYNGKADRDTLLLVCNILRGLESGKD